VALTIAKAIIDERAAAFVTAPSSTAAGRMVWLKQLGDDVPFIRIELDAAEAAEEVVRYAEARARELRASARELVQPVGNQTVRPALTAYRKYIKEKFTENGTLTGWGGVQIGIVDFLVKHLPDLLMDKLAMLGIEACLDVIRKRAPFQSRTRPYSLANCADSVGTIS
jgi:hypothetical protein